LEREFIRASLNVKKREQALWVGVGVAGVTLFLMVVLAITGKLNRFIYRPVDMEDYWVTIPAGEFLMGSENGDDNEKPVHTVYLNAYQIGKYEVTNKQYNQCIRAGMCVGSIVNTKFEYPVVDVNWYSAKTYCEWIGGRLPTEAEWEKAASWDDQAKRKRTYPWGETIDCTYANYRGKNGEVIENNDCVGHSMPVGSYESGKSPYGLYDMAGNVWEWVSSLYMAYPFDVNDGREDMSSANPRVLRGGVWYFISYNIRSAYRYPYNPSDALGITGFRCSRSP
jgi:formylglycine-generating enzyme required for sulfatase activity